VKKNIFLNVLIILVLLTAISALVSMNLIGSTYVAEIIIFLSILKFIGVSFYFMELKKAHIFWKASVLIYLLFFSTIVLVAI
jgi:uncharacterized membrane-anchored protein